MSFITIKVNSELHNKIKEITKKEGSTIVEVYSKMQSDFIKKYIDEEIVNDLNFETILNQKLEKIDNHLASMSATNGMLISANLYGFAKLFKALKNDIDIEDLIDSLTKDGEILFREFIKYKKQKKRDEV